MSGDLSLRRIPATRPHRACSIRLPGGRLIMTRDKGDSRLLSREQFISNLALIHRAGDGKIQDVRDLGSGLVTNAGVNLLANDFSWAGGATLKQANYHAIGTGTTAAAASDVYLQTAQGTTNLSGTTNGYMTGTQSLQPNATATPYSPVYQTVATFTATGAIAVTEWALTIGNAATISGTASATTSSSLTVAAAAFSGTGNGNQLWTVETSATAITAPTNASPTTQPMGQVKSNTSTVLTLLNPTPTWLSLTNQAVATPSATSDYVLFPTAFDHKVFAAVNMASGDTLQITYGLSCNSGG